MNFAIVANTAAVLSVIFGLIFVISYETLPKSAKVPAAFKQPPTERSLVSETYEGSFNTNKPKKRIVVLYYAKKAAFYLSGLAFFAIVFNFVFNTDPNGMLLPGIIAGAGFGLSQMWYVFPLIMIGVYFLLNQQKMI